MQILDPIVAFIGKLTFVSFDPYYLHNILEVFSNTELWIAPNIASGNYIVRHETVALHFATMGEIQYYPFCFNFNVTGSGAINPPGLVHSKLYSQSDPGFNYDVFADPLADYIIPGPPLAIF